MQNPANRNFNNSPGYVNNGTDTFDDRRIEGVTTCVGYSDFLDVTLEANMSHFDRFVVVTSFDDYETHAVCERHSVECVKTDLFFERGDDLNKGAALNLGLAHLRQNGWILSIDADIVLPDRFRNMLDKTHLDRESIYGAMRVNVPGWKAWKDFQDNSKHPQFHHRFLIDTPDNFPAGATLVHKEWGYCPIGYFMLWHSSRRVRYPAVSRSAEHDDVIHSMQWPRHKRHQLSTIRVYHLESEKAPMGANWNGRTTKKFGPEI